MLSCLVQLGLHTDIHFCVTLTTYVVTAMDHYNFSNISFNDNSPMLLHCPEMAFHQEGIDFTVYIPSMKGHILQSNRHRSGLKGDEVLVRITHSGLSNLNVYHQFTINQALGHSGVGIVGKVGPGVMNLNK